MPLPAAAREFYRAQQRLAVATVALVRAAWERMDMTDLDGSWDAVAPVLARVVTSGQLGAARNGAAFIAPTLDELGQSVEPVAQVRPAGFVGASSDGRGLASLLVWAKIHTKEAQSLDAGREWLGMAARTLIADAGRQAAGVGIYVRPGVGYVRAVNPPCCQRCAVLAGKFSRSEDAFDRHPGCDCFNVPTAEGATHPGVVIGAEDVKDLTKAQQRAIADGADMNQVINSYRVGARSKDKMTTLEGTTRRGLAGSRLGATRGRQGRATRLTPEGIYRVSATREEAIRRLRDNGYII